MKKVISISLGSSRRDHIVETSIFNEKIIIERRGTNGDKAKAANLFTELDGKYDAFGLGGIDLYIRSGDNRYRFRDAKKIIKNVKKTPVVDGTGLKNTLERRIVKYLEEKMGFDFSKYNILMVAAVDRFGMAESFADTGAKILFGDLIFGLGLPLAIKSFKTLHKVVSILAPFIVLLPFELLYPTGSKQNSGIKNADKYAKYYEWADIIAGDFHFINHYSPDNLENKIIITNTVTEDNIKKLKKKGVKLLITTTPEFNGRSFGTNVMEAVLVSILNQPVENITVDDYNNLLDKLNFLPRIINFD